MKNGERPIVNPFVRLREEFDDWAVLFDPDTGHGFGLSPTGVFLWKLLDGEHSIDDLLEEIRSHADGVPDEAIEHIRAFVDELAAEGLAGLGGAGSGLSAVAKRPENFSLPPCGHVCELNRFEYEPPKLVDLSGRRQAAYGDGDCTTGSNAVSGDCRTGYIAGFACHDGCSAQSEWPCQDGACTVNNHCCHGANPGIVDCANGSTPGFCCQNGTDTNFVTCKYGS